MHHTVRFYSENLVLLIVSQNRLKTYYRKHEEKPVFIPWHEVIAFIHFYNSSKSVIFQCTTNLSQPPEQKIWGTAAPFPLSQCPSCKLPTEIPSAWMQMQPSRWPAWPVSWQWSSSLLPSPFSFDTGGQFPGSAVKSVSRSFLIEFLSDQAKIDSFCIPLCSEWSGCKTGRPEQEIPLLTCFRIRVSKCQQN